MNKTISILRIAIIFVLGSLAIIFLFGEEQDESISGFLFHMIVDKVFAVTLCICIGKLYKRWSKIDPWFIAYDKMSDDVMDKPNPTQL